MGNYFLAKEYVAMALLKAKHDFFRERFITFSELNQFDYFMQQEFNNQNSGVIITSNSLSLEDFDIMGEIIMPSERCCFNLDRLPINVSSVLNNTNLTVRFFMNLESEKLKALEKVQVELPKLYQKKK